MDSEQKQPRKIVEAPPGGALTCGELAEVLSAVADPDEAVHLVVDGYSRPVVGALASDDRCVYIYTAR